MSSPYCSLTIRTDISGLTVRVGNAILNSQFNFQVGPTPPPEFFCLSGIYSQRTTACVRLTFDRLYAQQKVVNPDLADPFNNTNMNIFVQQMSYQQKLYFQELISLFQKVYLFNAAAYTYAGLHRSIPIYYTFETSSELSRYREANGVINKLYNVNSNYPLTSIFFLPFPPFCN